MKKKLVSLLLTLVVAAVCFLPAACNRVTIDENFEDDGAPYEIVYYMPVGQIQNVTDYERINDRLNEMLVEKLPNTTVDLIPIAWNEYTGKLSPIIGSAAEFDICFTSPVFNSYLTNVAMKAFYPLNNLLPKYAPQTYAKYNEKLWDSTRVNGEIYAVLNNQIMPRVGGLFISDGGHFDEFLAEKYPGYTKDTVYQNISDDINGFDPILFMEQYMDWLTQKQYGTGDNGRGITGFLDPSTWLMTWYNMDDLGTSMAVPGVIRVDRDNPDAKLTVINQFETEEFDRMMEYAIKWRNNGTIPADVTNRGNNADDLDVSVTPNWKPGSDVQHQDSSNGWRYNLRVSNDVNYYTSYILGTMNAVSATSRNPARALQFIELMETDEEVHNLLQFGELNIDYTIPDPEKPNRIESIENSGYNNEEMGWALGDEFLSYLQPEQQDGIWEEVAEINDTAYMGAHIGFLFDPTSVNTEILACTSVYNSYFNSSTGAGLGRADIQNGDPEANRAELQKFKQAMLDAGAQKIIDEKQRQLDAWLASKNA